MWKHTTCPPIEGGEKKNRGIFIQQDTENSLNKCIVYQLTNMAVSKLESWVRIASHKRTYWYSFKMSKDSK